MRIDPNKKPAIDDIYRGDSAAAAAAQKAAEAFKDSQLASAQGLANALKAPPTTISLPEESTFTLSPSANAALWMRERLLKQIIEFEEDLDPEEEVGAHLTAFGPNWTFHIDDVGAWGPDMIMFYGVDPSGAKLELLQHISQVSVLLVATPKTQEEPRRMGYRRDEDEQQTED